MPYKAFKVGEEFCVYKLDADDERTGDTLGCHATEDEAREQVEALYAAEELGEAATLKKQAQRLLRDAEAVMGNKKLPAGVGKAIKDLRSALRRNWADLAVDADDERTEEEPEEPVDEAVMKTEGGKEYPAKYYLVVEDSEKPNTWHLPWTRDGNPDHRLMGAAWASLHGGYRGQKYEGPGKAAAITKLKALYKREDMEAPSSETASVVAGMLELAELAGYLAGLFVEKQEAEPVEAVESVALGESDVGAVLALHESEDVEGTVAPLQMDVVVIKPGWGNQKDNHYYSRELLQKYSHVFNGAKMYATNHVPDEKNVLTEVSQVLACPAAFTDDGAPIARVGVFDETFAQNIRNRAALGKLESLNVSIQANGKAKSFELDGRKGKTVVEIDPEGANVDWVTRAGAGGHALRLAESEEEQDMPDEERQEEQTEEATAEEVAIEEQQDEPEAEIVEQEPAEEAEPTILDADAVEALLAESNLPDASRARLAEKEFADEDVLKEAINIEAAYVAQLTGAGRPVGQETPAAQEKEKAIGERLRERYDEIEKRYGVFRGDLNQEDQ